MLIRSRHWMEKSSPRDSSSAAKRSSSPLPRASSRRRTAAARPSRSTQTGIETGAPGPWPSSSSTAQRSMSCSGLQSTLSSGRCLMRLACEFICLQQLALTDLESFSSSFLRSFRPSAAMPRTRACGSGGGGASLPPPAHGAPCAAAPGAPPSGRARSPFPDAAESERSGRVNLSGPLLGRLSPSPASSPLPSEFWGGSGSSAASTPA
mmetsp:Transcript_54004/g.157661  ORF Transcript_54004/g.157661 Transcript_54004/m.157661 type:complete len:208 (+) Transcript_54004:472-1095(+)